MKIPFLALILILFSGCTSTKMYLELDAGDEFPTHWLTTQTNLTELKNDYENIGDDIHPRSVKEWSRFLANFKDEYEIWNFQDETSWAFGLTGYVMLKDGIIIDLMGGFMKKEDSNQASHTMPANARLFHSDLMKINLNRLGTSTEADIVWI